jgi:hypothetical protein
LINKLNKYKLDFRLSQGKNAVGLFQAESQVLAIRLVADHEGQVYGGKLSISTGC